MKEKEKSNNIHNSDDFLTTQELELLKNKNFNDFNSKNDNSEKENELTPEEQAKKRKKSAIKYILNIAFVLIATILSLYFALKDNFNEVISYLGSSDWKWILVIVGVMLAMTILRSLVLFCFARLYTRKYHMYQALAVDQIGIFYNAVTPGASGGEVMQAYTFKKQGIPVSSSVSIMAMYSIVFQTVLIIYGIVSFCVEYDFIMSLNDWVINLGFFTLSIPMWVLAILGFLLNAAVILIVLLMGYWRGFHNFIMGPCISLLTKMRIVKKPDERREKLRVQVENFKIELRRLLTNIPFFLLVAFLFFLYLTMRFSIPYFVGIALGNESTVASFWNSVFLSNFHQMVTGLIPLPGSAGVSELFFYELFLNRDNLVQSFYAVSVNGSFDETASTALCQASLVLWRSLTFAIPIIAGGICSAFYKASPKALVTDRGDVPNRDTLTLMQSETLQLRETEVKEAEQALVTSIKNKFKKHKSLNADAKRKNTEKPYDDKHNSRITTIHDEKEDDK